MAMIAAVPFQLNDGGVLFDSNEPGFHRMNRSLQELGRMTAEGRTEMIGLDAIPSCIAHVIKLHNDMRTQGLAERYAEERWRKAMVVFALSRYRAYEVDIEEIQEKDCNPLVWNFFGKKLAEETQMRDRVYLLRFRGRGVAIFDRKGYLLPVAEFPVELSKELGEDCVRGLEDYERDVLRTYLERLSERTTEYRQYIDSFIGALERAGARKRENGEYRYEEASDGYREEMFERSAGGSRFWEIPALAVRLPVVFHPRMVLAIAQKEQGRICGFGLDKTLAFQAEVKGGPLFLSALLPLAEGMADFLEREREVVLEEVRLDDAAFRQEQGLGVELTFIVCGERIRLKKHYRKDQISYADSMPLVTVFPYVRLPEEVWRCYYLVLMRGKQKKGPEFMQGFQTMAGDGIDLMEKDAGCSTESEKNRKEWYYSRQSALSSYIKLCRADFSLEDPVRNERKKNDYIGCIYVGEPSITQKENRKTFRWAIDMGTRNTIAAYKNADTMSISYTLVRKGLYRTLLMGAEGNRDIYFARSYYAPDNEVSGKFPTMSRVYREGYGKEEYNCYEQGCALFPDVELLNELLRNEEALLSDYVVTDVKFGKNDVLHEVALRIFLHNMLWLGCLECALEGAKEIQVCISYPRTDVGKRIKQIWDTVRAQMGRVSGVAIKDFLYFTEAEANARYLQRTLAGGTVPEIVEGSTFGICDIGDGTTEFNLFMGETGKEGLPGRIQFSMRYAGGDIVVSTIERLFRGLDQDFRNMWDIPANEKDWGEKKELYEKAKELIKAYCQFDRIDIKSAEGAGIYENKRNIILTLLENVRLKENLLLSANHNYANFIAVMAFKYWNLFQTYGEILRLFSDDKILTFKMFLYGGGRQALKNVTGRPLNEFSKTEFGGDIIRFLSVQCGLQRDAFTILMDDGYRKDEVVTGMVDNSDDIAAIRSQAYDTRGSIDEYYIRKHSGDLHGDWLDKDLLELLLREYEAYVEKTREYESLNVYMKGENEEASIYEVISVRESGKEIHGDNRTEFRNRAESLWRQISQDEDNPRCLFKVLFFVKMSNHLLMRKL